MVKTKLSFVSFEQVSVTLICRWYRGIAKREANTLVGHEAIGVVEQASAYVSQIKAGDFVIVPFTHG